MSTPPQITTPLTALTGIAHPIVQTALGWVSGPRLVSATARAGALGILASATMTFGELEAAILAVRARTDQPFGVNLRANAGDVMARAELLITHRVTVASFALAPSRELIDLLKDGGVVVIPSIGSIRHAEKLQSWGADAVMLAGGEGGGHVGSIPTSLLLPSVTAAVEIPVVAAGGYFDGRGLAAALAYGAVGIGMGTRFLLTRESPVPRAVKERYLAAGLDGTVVTTKADGKAYRLLRTEYVEGLDSSSIDPQELAVSTPHRLRAGLVDGDAGAGVLASGQVVGVIDDLPTVEELVDRIVREAVVRLRAAAATVIR
ncbi:NAD(P)H-dependent flavin oxidoreductase [uncultured Microbacterium sp.]|uniref:NAD(P)H-dependent flavin oxidoreductase n=1 Tax=uncultured Microbacterium sp. TaxID=191216 RepID=UPI0035CC8FBD